MKLDSVRDLKNTLFTKRLMPAGLFQLDVSVGIAQSRRGKGYELAVRLHEKKHPLLAKFLEMTEKLSCGELDVQSVGVIKALINCVADPNGGPCELHKPITGAGWAYEGSRPVSDDDHMFRQKRCRPMLAGCSVGHPSITCGSIGGWVQDQDGKQYLISNNHVIAAQDTAKVSDPIIQCGSHDGGTVEKDTVAHLSRFVELKPKGNLVDCGIAEINSGIEFDPHTITGVGKFSGKFADVELGEPVFKFGRTTGRTAGVCTAIEMSGLRVDYDRGVIEFDQQIEVEGNPDTKSSFSAGGDSGSGVVNANGDMVALLFAGGPHGGRNGCGLTYCNPIDLVVNALDGIRLIS